MAVRRTVTVRQAAELTGLSVSALNARINRGTLKARKEGTRRVIPIEALYGAGLISVDVGATVADLFDRLEASYRRIGELEAENRRLKERR